MKGLIFCDVDTQNDFMRKDGALYVPEAETIVPNLKLLTEYARRNNYKILGSVDRHFKTDAELQRNSGPFPDHCMDNTYGQEKVIKPLNAVFVPNKKLSKKELEQIVKQNEIFFEKQHYDVFTNPNAEPLLKDVDYAVVYGVATDYCVKAAVLGLRKLDVEVFLVTDAIKGVTADGEKSALKEMKQNGVFFMTTKEVLEGKVLRYIRAMEGIIN